MNATAHPGAAGAAEPPGGSPLPTLDVDRSDPVYRTWLKEAVRKVQADANRSADTHLLRFPLPPEWGIDLYFRENLHIAMTCTNTQNGRLRGYFDGYLRFTSRSTPEQRSPSAASPNASASPRDRR